jgi:fumarylacetoacetate (FAA) hydrolase family protein
MDGFDARQVLPEDADRATLVGRAWVGGAIEGPAVVAVRGADVHDLSAIVPTMRDLLERDDAVTIAREAEAPRLCSVEELVASSRWDRRRTARPHLLAPCDLQAVKAAGVTFAKSMIERVVEEQARGDPKRAAAVRAEIEARVGGALETIRPGSPEAERLKQHLQAIGAWSQYLEVGLGPWAEIFTKCQPMAAVGHGAEIGIHPESAWNNPEPEIVLVVDSRGRIRGATLGNDVNLRDFEGRSALLLGRAKDNNGSAAIGPFIRLFDDRFGPDDVRAAEVDLRVQGADDGFVLGGRSSMRHISRDIEELVAHTIGPNHQYPDGFVLMCGTMFAPTEDRDSPGAGFTHHIGDVVEISSPRLGRLVNRVDRCDRIPPWTFGTGALLHNLAARGLLRG